MSNIYKKQKELISEFQNKLLEDGILRENFTTKKDYYSNISRCINRTVNDLFSWLNKEGDKDRVDEDELFESKLYGESPFITFKTVEKYLCDIRGESKSKTFPSIQNNNRFNWSAIAIYTGYFGWSGFIMNPKLTIIEGKIRYGLNTKDTELSNYFLKSSNLPNSHDKASAAIIFNSIVDYEILSDKLIKSIESYFDVRNEWYDRFSIAAALSLSILNGWDSNKVKLLVRLATYRNEPLVSERAINGLA